MRLEFWRGWITIIGAPIWFLGETGALGFRMIGDQSQALMLKPDFWNGSAAGHLSNCLLTSLFS